MMCNIFVQLCVSNNRIEKKVFHLRKTKPQQVISKLAGVAFAMGLPYTFADEIRSEI